MVFEFVGAYKLRLLCCFTKRTRFLWNTSHFSFRETDTKAKKWRNGGIILVADDYNWLTFLLAYIFIKI